MPIIPHQSEKRFVTSLIKNGQNSNRPNRIQSEATIRTNQKPSFESESIRAQINPNRIFNQNQSE